MKKTILVIFCLTALAACKKEKVEGPEGPAGTNGTGIPGTITGKVTQYDQSGATYTTGLNTTTVEIQGSNYTTTTDVNGNYTLTNVMPGTYNISYIKIGCGFWQQQQITFAGNGTYYSNGSVLEKATYTFNNATIKDSLVFSNHKIYFTVNLASSINTKGGLVISGTNSNPDITDPTSYKNVNSFSIPPNTSTFQFLLGTAFTGTTYYKIYPYPNAPFASSYYDLPLNKPIYTAYGTPLPTTYSITIP
jgi:hypothetical protein